MDRLLKKEGKCLSVRWTVESLLVSQCISWLINTDWWWQPDTSFAKVRPARLKLKALELPKTTQISALYTHTVKNYTAHLYLVSSSTQFLTAAKYLFSDKNLYVIYASVAESEASVTLPK